MHPQLIAVTERIIERSQSSRAQYLQHIEASLKQTPERMQVSCSNQAHIYASAAESEKLILKQNHRAADLAIITAYNDMLSAHAPYEHYPALLKAAVAELGHVAQVAGGVPAMCDGITQGQLGMELSLFSRDAIALSTAIALSHQAFDGVMLLGICDKIVPGLLMAALRFGHLPAMFIPAGPMASGISNHEKAQVRQAYAQGKVDQSALLNSEMQAYHGVGTCTFYGTANSNQVLMEVMGLQLPGSSFVPPDSSLRMALNRYAAQRICALTPLEPDYLPLGQMLDERSFVNAIVGLLATGGSTNHTIHLIAMAKMAGIQITWQDMDELSKCVPLLARIYPNGSADINEFQQAGGMAFLIRELLAAGLLHEDVLTVMGRGLAAYTRQPCLDEKGHLHWCEVPLHSLNRHVLRSHSEPFLAEGGIKLLQGNLGSAVMKVSAVPEEQWCIEAPARVFNTQEAVLQAYRQGEFTEDVIVVLKEQGPAANGMPELHQLIPALSNLQQAGLRVALVTDGRLSGASGAVPAALHVSPEAVLGGFLAAIKDGDVVCLDAHSGQLSVKTLGFEQRTCAPYQAPPSLGVGRELFGLFRAAVTPAHLGAISIGWGE